MDKFCALYAEPQQYGIGLSQKGLLRKGCVVILARSSHSCERMSTAIQ
jgi:hypothetical protein